MQRFGRAATDEKFCLKMPSGPIAMRAGGGLRYLIRTGDSSTWWGFRGGAGGGAGAWAGLSFSVSVTMNRKGWRLALVEF